MFTFFFFAFGATDDSCFGAFFNHPHQAALFSNFFLLHITAPGQEPNADELSSELTFDMLVEQVETVGVVVAMHAPMILANAPAQSAWLLQIRQHFALRNFFSLGVGLGAVTLLHYACKYPQRVRGQILT